jgi:hypothetical protein
MSGRLVLLVGVLVVLISSLMPCSSLSVAQEEVVPPELKAPFESIIQEMRFEKPTRIMARLLTMDAYENAIWVEWTSRHDGASWVTVPGRRQFKLLPRNPDMMEYFKSLKPGTSLKMTIQMDQDGNRRVLELDDAA